MEIEYAAKIQGMVEDPANNRGYFCIFAVGLGLDHTLMGCVKYLGGFSRYRDSAHRWTVC